MKPGFISLLLWGSCITAYTQPQKGSSVALGSAFSFVLKDSATTSAGVYTKDSVLVRTLWGGKLFGPGKHLSQWDGLDDDGRLVNDGSYDIRVLSNKVKYVWEGVIGNNSDSSTGSSVFTGYSFMNGMAIAGNTAYYTKNYSEGSPSYAKFLLNKPHSKIWLTNIHAGITSYGVATDGQKVYWTNTDPSNIANSFVFATNTNDDAETGFYAGKPFTTTYGLKFISAIDVVHDKNGQPTGVAVQKAGKFLFVAHAALNAIHVLDKTTGQLVQTIPINNPSSLATDDFGNIWVRFIDNQVAVIKKFPIGPDGTLLPPQLSLSGLIGPLAIAVSPNNQLILVADGDSSQQLKAFDTKTGKPLWVFGQAGGYSKDPLVSYDKFYFSDLRRSFSQNNQTFIAFENDGSFWVGDVGNARTIHYNPNKQFIDAIMYLPCSYSCVVDPNRPTRVFSDYLEFKVDYSKPLMPNNGSWVLYKNWGATIPDSLDANFIRFTSLTTLSNGRTYALFAQPDRKNWQLAELPANGTLRFTGIAIPELGSTQLYKDGSLRTTPRIEIGKPINWDIQPLAGFDQYGNPRWQPQKILSSSPPTTGDDPGYQGNGIFRAGEITSSGVLISFDNGITNKTNDKSFHLGGIKIGSHHWLWKTARATNKNYSGDFPNDGSYDIGNGVQYGGSVQLVAQQHVFWGYHGEFWKASQTNKWNDVWDDGLLIGQFGATGADSKGEAAKGMAGNALSASLVIINDSLFYLYHNDESFHGGVHRWRISGLGTVQEQTMSITVQTPTAKGFTVELFDDSLLNNAHLINRSVIDITHMKNDRNNSWGNSLLSANSSAIFSGFIQPVSSEMYTFYTGVNKGSRLWIDGKLLVDNYRDNQTNKDSGNIILASNKRYAVKMEFTNKGGNQLPQLQWHTPSISLQAVPSSQVIPSNAAIKTRRIDLMAGLSYNGVVENGLYGWTKYPAVRDTARNTLSLDVKTNIKTFSLFKSPDIFIGSLGSNGSAFLERNLGSRNSAIFNWTLYGNINFDHSVPNFGKGPEDLYSGGSFFEILDSKARVLLRIYGIVTHWDDDVRLYVNDSIIFKTNFTDFNKFIDSPNQIKISHSFGKLTVQFGNLRPVTVGSFISEGDLNYPQTMRVFVWINGHNYGRFIDLEGFFFENKIANGNQ